MAVVACPKCATPLNIPDTMAGMTVACPKCGQQLKIPGGPSQGVQAKPPQAAQPSRQAVAPGQPPTPRPAPQAAPQPALNVGRPGIQAGGTETIAAPTSMLTTMSKPVLFGLLGAIGCMLGAMFIELPHYLILPPPPKEVINKPTATKPLADIMFVLDVTGSMQNQINGVRNGIGRFLDKMKDMDIDARVGVTYYRDRFDQPDGPAEDPVTLVFKNKEQYTTDPEDFRNAMAGLLAARGGDIPESTMDALVISGRVPTRPNAAKVLILITDAPPKIPDKDMRDMAQCKAELQRIKVQQLHLITNEGRLFYHALMDKLQKVVSTGEKDSVTTLVDRTPKGGKLPLDAITGMEFSLTEVAAGRSFDEALPRISASVAEETKLRSPGIAGLGSTVAFDASQGGRVLFAKVLMGAFLGFGLALLLIMGQKMYLRQSWLTAGSFTKASLGLAAGAVGGLVAQGLVMAAGSEGAIAFIFQVFGWTLLGSLVGVGMAFFVPNLIWHRGLLGGTIGGVAGGIGFVLFALLLGDLLGRWIGAFVLGFCIGVMVALAEVAFRRWWLEVRFGPREVRTVTLGSSVISVGSDERQATLVVRDVPGLVLRYHLRDQKVLCQDAASGQTNELQPGDSRKVGNVTITVCSPETVQKVGLELKLSSGRSVPLAEGLPLTADELPGLVASAPDGTVALVSRKPADPNVLLMHNRSKQAWAMVDRAGQQKVIDPGRGLNVEEGVRINFGQVQGELVRTRG